MKTLLFIRSNKTKKQLVESIAAFSNYTCIEQKDNILKELLSGKEMNAPYNLLITEMADSDLYHQEFVDKIRDAEKKKQIEKIKIIVLLDLKIHYKFEEQNSLSADAYLIKPFESSEIDKILLKLGFDTLTVDKRVDKSSKELIDLKKIIYNHRYKDQEFRVFIEKKVKEIGSEGEKLLGELICTEHIEFITRVNLIRVAGYIRSSILLTYLENNLKNKNNITIIKETIIAISKFNNLESIKILNNALKGIANTLLIRKINDEISKIKQNNPIIGLLPRFLEGGKDNKKFKVTVNILKEIICSADSDIFIKYLSDESETIRTGAFEILSFKGESSIHQEINDFFEKSISVKSSSNVPVFKNIERTCNHYKNYLLRFPKLITTYGGNIKNVFNRVEALEAKRHLISILANSCNIDDIDFVKKAYIIDKNLQKDIIIQFSKNKVAVPFLFEKYKSDSKNGTLMVKSLLNTEAGIGYFMKVFFDEETEIKETVAKYIFIKEPEKRVLFVKNVFNSSLFNVKRIILNRILDFYDYSLKDILFDPKFEREFLSIEKDYLLATSKAFPITLIEKLIFKMSTTSYTLQRIKRFLTIIQNIQIREPIIVFKSKDMLNTFLESIISKNNLEINLTVLNVLGNLNILDMRSYDILINGLNHFYSKRGDKLSAAELNKVHNIRKHYISNFKDIKKKEDFIKELKVIVSKKTIEFDMLRQFISYSNMAVALAIEKFVNVLINAIEGSDPGLKVKWMEFLDYFPLLKKIILAKIEKVNVEKGASRNLEQFIKIVISFHNQETTVLFYDQLKILFSDYIIETDPDKLEPNDILLCDSTKLKRYIENNNLSTSNIFLLLDNNNEFASFKKYNPKFFVKPFSLHKVVRQLYQSLYFIN